MEETDNVTCNSRVLLPTPGSPPMSTMDPGTTPPPSTRPSSAPPGPLRGSLQASPYPPLLTSVKLCGPANLKSEYFNVIYKLVYFSVIGN